MNGKRATSGGEADDAADTGYRRRHLLAGLATATTVGLAGCGGGGTEGATATDTGTPYAEAATVAVGPGGRFAFEPATLRIRPGATVTWVWKSSNHNVVPVDQPDDADWQGTEGGAGSVYGRGHEHRFTFDVPGTYEYVCTPHESVGMTGSVEVVEA